MLKYKNLLCINLRQGNISTINNLNMSNWLEHSVQIEVEIPIEQVWELWSDLKEMPKWMKWIDSVEILDDDPNLSRWKLVSGGFQFTWISKILKVSIFYIFYTLILEKNNSIFNL